MIVAYSKNRVIGRTNDMPWKLSADLRHFKELTSGKTVVMGSKTFESIVTRLGHGLPNRRNIVLSRDPNYSATGAEVVTDIPTALKSIDEEVMIIGGGEIFKLALPFTDKIYATEIDAEIDGDTYFPELKASDWQRNVTETHQEDEQNNYSFSFVTYERTK